MKWPFFTMGFACGIAGAVLQHAETKTAQAIGIVFIVQAVIFVLLAFGRLILRGINDAGAPPAGVCACCRRPVR